MQHELVQRAQHGDRESFGVLVHGTIARLYASARLILRDSDRAEDACATRTDLTPGSTDLLVRSCYRAAKKDRRRQITEIPHNGG